MSALATNLPIGHYAVGILEGGEEIDIYRASASVLLNVATNQPVKIAAWHKPDKKHLAPSLPF